MCIRDSPGAENYDPLAEVSDESCAFAVPDGWQNPGFVDPTKSQAWAVFFSVPSEPGDAIGAFVGDLNVGFTMLSVGEGMNAQFATVPIQVANQGVGMGPISFRRYDASEGSVTPIGIQPEGGTFEFSLNSVTHFGCDDPTMANYAPWADSHAEICADNSEP